MNDLSRQALAEACAEALWDADPASRKLGMTIVEIGPGRAVLEMTVTEAMVNGHGLCHGGFVFTLADSAFAFAANTVDERSVGQHAAITYVAPAHAGDVLTATAREISRRGRGGITDVTVTNEKGEVIAEFRGHSRTVKGGLLPRGDG